MQQDGTRTPPADAQDAARAGAQSTYALVAAIEAKDPFIRGHSAEVARIAVAIGREMGLADTAIESLRIASILHDVGKISVPGEVLNKPGKLSWPEWQLVKTHVAQGLRILSEAKFSSQIKAAVAQHHERLDGSGYPQGLRGDQIVLDARILAVADVFEAMTSHRPYRPAASVPETVEYLQANAGSKFDRSVVQAFVKILADEHQDLMPSSPPISHSYSHDARQDDRQEHANVRRVIRRRVLVRRRK